LRPVKAHWFQLVTTRKDVAEVMECLAKTGAVELEASNEPIAHLLIGGIDEELKDYRALAEHDRPFWPPPADTVLHLAEPIDEALKKALADLRAWASDADPLIAKIEHLAQQIRDLELFAEAAKLAGTAFDNVEPFAAAGPRLAAVLIALPTHTVFAGLPPAVLFKDFDGLKTTYVLLLGPQAEIAEVRAMLPGLKGRIVPFPESVPVGTDKAQTIALRLADLQQSRLTAKNDLARLSQQHELPRILATIALIEWLNEHARELRASDRLVFVTGWTSDPDGKRLRTALDAMGGHYHLKVSAAPSDSNAPLLLSNPRFARGFEIFARMRGTPAQDESDPSLVLSFIAPILFGFMFGDVGQGLVIFVTGLVFRRRWPLLAMLVPGGLAAIAFGAAFGSLFCREDLLPALWLRPLGEPLRLLGASIVIGIGVLSIGLLFDAMQAHWRGEAASWWQSKAGFVLAYYALIAAPFRIAALWFALFGVLWYVLGAARAAGRQWPRAILSATVEFSVEGLQLLVNTASFARVGAFALAHAGLSLAVVGIASTAGGAGYWIVLTLGNVLVVGLEGLVVGIQTTRLVLFEFFIRFLRAGGRPFRPLPPPDIAAKNPFAAADERP
jgi:V/A-type H+-transporting ATPase subunit I